MDITIKKHKKGETYDPVFVKIGGKVRRCKIKYPQEDGVVKFKNAFDGLKMNIVITDKNGKTHTFDDADGIDIFYFK